MKKLKYEKPKVTKKEFKDLIRTSENADPLGGGVFGTSSGYKKPE